MKPPEPLRQPWLHDQTHLLLWMFALVSYLLFWFQLIQGYISVTMFIGSEDHLLYHDICWGLSVFDLMALMALGYAVYALVTLGGVITTCKSRITQLACVAILITAFLSVVQPIISQKLLLRSSRETLARYRVMLAEGIDNPYVEEQIIEFSRNLEIILRDED